MAITEAMRDMVRSGEREHLGAPLLKKFLSKQGWTVDFFGL